MLLCISFYPLRYHFANLNFICHNNNNNNNNNNNINNLYIRPSFHFTYDTDEEIIDFEICLSIIQFQTM